ncbi:MAG: tetratricopeptide repeat protein, partial [Anaerolineales bacterium]|nr:tetratricopeptide repeat protein [Anaerolineales bacterium]
LEEEPQNVMVWTNLGAAYLGNPILARPEEQDRAIEAFKQALVHDPIAPNVAYNIGLIYRDQKNIDEATYWFRKAIQANPRDNDARAWLDKMESAAEEQE